MSTAKSLFPVFIGILALATTGQSQLWDSQQLPAGVNDLSVLDYDADGDLDVLGGGNIRIMTNQFPIEWVYESHPLLPGGGGMAHDMQFLDFEVDGDFDVVYYGFDYDNIIGFHLGWLENLGDWQFEAHVIAEFDDGYSQNTLSAGDVDNDGDIDIVTTLDAAGGSGVLLLLQTNPTEFQQVELDTTNHFNVSRLADLNADGNLDFVVQILDNFDPDPSGLGVYFGDGAGGFSQVLIASTWQCDSTEPKIGDFDGDGDPDIVWYHSEDNNYTHDAALSWWENDGAGGFAEHPVWEDDETNFAPIPVAMLDVDNDGDMDLALGPDLFVNQGDNIAFEESAYSDLTIWDFDQLIAADIDNDGDIDLLNEDVRWFENQLLDPPNFIIRLVPRQTEIPANGGPLIYDGMIYSQLAQTRTGLVWADVVTPGGNTIRWWIRQGTFAPGQWYDFENVTSNVPGWAPPGDYQMKVRAGIPNVIETQGDSLDFEKVGEGARVQVWPPVRERQTKSFSELH